MSRAFTDCYSELEQRGADYYTAHQHTETVVPRLVSCFRKLIELKGNERLLVIGCGPKPQTMLDFAAFGFEVIGVEPIAAYVDSANVALQRCAVRLGDAEHLPFEDGTIQLVVMESVLEHVESPLKAMQEMFRILKPGGVAYVYTNNRLRISLRGDCGEYRVPFFNWFPKVIKESYVYRHMHVDPTLANFTPRPAVHWFCYSDLCELGRCAGFFLFYSTLDLADPSDMVIRKSRIRRMMLPLVRSSPWLRGLALLQFGTAVFMYKRR
jgi:ubiquinone/menaquinone biosynthesis C-methylase UbiE